MCTTQSMLSTATSLLCRPLAFASSYTHHKQCLQACGVCIHSCTRSMGSMQGARLAGARGRACHLASRYTRWTAARRRLTAANSGSRATAHAGPSRTSQSTRLRAGRQAPARQGLFSLCRPGCQQHFQPHSSCMPATSTRSFLPSLFQTYTIQKAGLMTVSARP